MARAARQGMGEGGVSEVLGSILLVGITVITVAALAALVLSYRGPADKTYVDLEIVAHKGAGGWGSGDETLQVRHLGGEALRMRDTHLAYSVNGIVRPTLDGDDLGPAFTGDGRLTIGEVAVGPPETLAASDDVQVQVVITGEDARVVAAATLVPGLSEGGVSCALDTSPPSVQSWLLSTDIATTTVGSVTFTATLTDDCSGLSPTMPAPNLEYCITPGTSWTSAGAMANVGTNQWQRAISGVTWASFSGETLRFRVNPIVDAAVPPNSAPSAAGSELINGLTTYTYVAGTTPTAGTVSALASAQSSCDAGAEATLLEEKAATSTLSGTSTTGSASVTNPNNALVDDNANQAVLNDASDALDVSGFTAPGGVVAITRVDIGFEGKKSSSSSGNPVVVLSYLVGATPGATTRTVTLSSTSDEQEFTQDVTDDRAWTTADLASLKVRVLRSSIDSGFQDASIDHAYATVTYTTAAGTQYTTKVQLEWAGLPNTVTQRLELRYRVTSPGDTFTVQAWQGGTTWRTCAGSLTATAATTYTCDLIVASEYQAGAPRVRVLDAAPQGANQGSLLLEYARVRSL